MIITGEDGGNSSDDPMSPVEDGASLSIGMRAEYGHDRLK